MKNAYYNSPFGIIQIGYEKETLLLLKLVKKIGEKNEISNFTHKVYQQICEYLDGERKNFDISYIFHGTKFQEMVWLTLETIPYGSTMTYGEVAKYIGNPNATRAVGKACNANPIWLIVPCHRVIGKHHSLIGYAYGVNMKEKLLQIEQSHIL